MFSQENYLVDLLEKKKENWLFFRFLYFFLLQNKMYYQVIKDVVKNIKVVGKKIYMLDIGIGIGFLVMMVVRSGVDGVIVCEVINYFFSMYEINCVILDF